MIQHYRITDITRQLVGGEGFAAVTLSSTEEQGGFAPGIQSQAQLRVTGIPLADAESWRLGDIIPLTLG